MIIKDFLFKGFCGCNDHNCIVKDNTGMCTNGGCRCMTNFSRGQLNILASRIQVISDKEINLQEKVKDE